MLSKLITLVVVPVNYHFFPTYLIFNANGINRHEYSAIVWVVDVLTGEDKNSRTWPTI